MSTYNIGLPPVDATKLEDLQSVLNGLPDNTSKLISPKRVRDAVYTLWETISLKQTTIPSSLVSYTGIDQDTLINKIFLGKKKVSGSYVMNDSLLNSDVDIFLFNTKNEPTSNHNTKIAILAGTGSNYSSGNVITPYLESSVINTVDGNYINLTIGNSSFITQGTMSYGGDINIKSDHGNLNFNGIVWPSYLDTYTNPSSKNDFVLKYKYIGGQVYATWENMASQSVTSIISSGTVSISGNPVILNGLDINFTESTPIPTSIGGIGVGETFSNVHITTMVRRILYPYIKPTISTYMSPLLIESGGYTPGSVRLYYTINRTSPTASITSLSVIGPYPGGLISPGSVVVGLTTSSVPVTLFSATTAYTYNLPGTQSYSSNTWTMSMVDSAGTVATSSSSMKVVIPWYYGTSTFSCTTTTGSGNINNILGTQSTYSSSKLTPFLSEPVISATYSNNKLLTMTTFGLGPYNQGYLYFGYPSDFPDLINIIDQNGYDVIGSFKKYTITGVQSPNIYWSGKSYKFYIYVGPGGATPSLTTLGSIPGYNSTYQFNFA